MQLPGYRIVRKINQGGMSTVYLAVQTNLNRLVAIKVMAPALNADPVFSERFQREAKIVGRLSHPNIIAIHDIGSSETTNYIAMDYMENGSISAKIKRGMSAKEALKIVQQMALALNHAHSEGYIHRDIKPENILLRADNTAVLSDFGVARSVSNNTQMTNAGTVLGTPNYMSPEQARGKNLDGRSDIYSLGIVLYEMLVGEPPYHGEEAVAIALQHLTAPPPKLPKKYASLQPLLTKMVAKKPAERFQTGKELATAVESILNKLNSSSSKKDQNPKSDKANEQNPEPSKKTNRLWNWLPAWLRLSAKKSNLTREFDRFIGENPNKQTQLRLLWVVVPVVMASCSALAFWYWQSYQNLPQILNTASSSEKLVIEHSGATQVDPPTETYLTLAAPSQAGDTKEKPSAQEPERYALTVKVKPDIAQVRIMNIKDKYQPGIKLSSGRYLLELQAEGYYLQEQWLTIENQPKSVTITLEKAHQPGDKIQHTLSEDLPSPTMVVVSPGQFIMGSLRYPDSQPRHEVIFDRPFAVSETEVSFAQMDAYLRDTQQQLLLDQGWGRDRRPAINVTWDQAQAYANWLAEKTQQPYRLLSEAEWEYTASNYGSQEYPWTSGDKSGGIQANCKRGCDSEFTTLFISKTSPVKHFTASNLGIYDLAGNVAEWTSSCFTPSYSSGAAKNCERVVRGGSFLDSVEDLNVFRRGHYAPEFSDKFIGFRVLLELPKISLIDS